MSSWKKKILNFKVEMKWLVNGFMQFERGKKFVHQENPENPNPNVPTNPVSDQSPLFLNRKKFLSVMVIVTIRIQNSGGIRMLGGIKNVYRVSGGIKSVNWFTLTDYLSYVFLKC